MSSAYKYPQKIKWQCSMGHNWETAPHDVVSRGSWCKLCVLRKDTKEIKEIAMSAGYYLPHPESYLAVDKPIWVMHIDCKREFYSTLRNIQKNACTKCRKTHRPAFREEAEAYAAERGGKIIEWNQRASGKTKWECKDGHRWLAAWTRVVNNGYWCGKCAQKFKKNTDPKVNLRRLAKKSMSTYLKYDKNKGFETTVTWEDIMIAKQSTCHYCDRVASGFDRIDNTVGHTKENCIPCCIRCNWVRGSWLSFEVMVEVGKLLQTVDP